MPSLNKVKNSFKGLSDEEWRKYATELEPHFTEEPYYENIPWVQIKARIEDSAKDAGFDVILRTTNNKAYCPDTRDLDWNQETKWIFGYKDKRIIIHITYAEQLEKNEWKNFVSIEVHMELPQRETAKSLDKTSPNFKDGIPCRDAHIYFQPCPPEGYVSNGGFVSPGTTEFHYINLQTKNLHWQYEKLQKEYKHPGWTNILERDITPTFFKEWLEKNPIISGKIEDIHMWGYSGTFTFPGNPRSICLLMDYLFLNKLMRSAVTEYIIDPWSRECTSMVSDFFWSQCGKTEKTCSILEGELGGYWYPVYNRECKRPITEYNSLRFTPKLQKLIDEDFSSIIVN